MNEIAKIDESKSKGLTALMAEKFQMEPSAFVGAIKKTCFKQDCTNEQLAAFLMVAKEYGLNPLTREVYAFPANGGIQPIVSIDGWMKLINNHPEFDGMDFEDALSSDGKLVSVTCRIFRKDRNRAIEVTEYMQECARGTEPWKKWPNRMLRHKAAIQCARYAFSFSNIADPDEYERIVEVETVDQQVLDRYSKPKVIEHQTEGFNSNGIDAEIEEMESQSVKKDTPATDLEQDHSLTGKAGAEEEPEDDLSGLEDGSSSNSDENWDIVIWDEYVVPVFEVAQNADADLSPKVIAERAKETSQAAKERFAAIGMPDDKIKALTQIWNSLVSCLKGDVEFETSLQHWKDTLTGADDEA